MTHSNKKDKGFSKKGFGSTSSNYTTRNTHVVPSNKYSADAFTNIAFESINESYEADPSLIFEDLELVLNFKKIKMRNSEKLDHIKNMVRLYKLSDTCKAAINTLCLAKFGGGING